MFFKVFHCIVCSLRILEGLVHAPRSIRWYQPSSIMMIIAEICSCFSYIWSVCTNYTLSTVYKLIHSLVLLQSLHCSFLLSSTEVVRSESDVIRGSHMFRLRSWQLILFVQWFVVSGSSSLNNVSYCHSWFILMFMDDYLHAGEQMSWNLI